LFKTSQNPSGTITVHDVLRPRQLAAPLIEGAQALGLGGDLRFAGRFVPPEGHDVEGKPDPPAQRSNDQNLWMALGEVT
jgi:hypothetical protein